MYRKILLTLICFLTVSFSFLRFTTPAKAQAPNPWYDQSYQEWFTKVYDSQTSPPDEIFGERYTAAQVQWVLYSLIASIKRGNRSLDLCVLNGDPNNCVAGVIDGIADAANPEGDRDKPVLAQLFSSNREMSGVGYVRQKLANYSIIPQAQAQVEGFGFGALSPLQSIWTVTRNVAYSFSVIIVLVFAFMIMFRVRLNPQTVVTVQSALPKIIIALILATFSYAIAGFLVDLTYVAIGLIAFVFDQTGIFLNTDWGDLFNMLTAGPGNRGVFGWLTYMGGLLFNGIFGISFGANGLGNIDPLAITLGLGIVALIVLLIFILWAIIAFLKIIFLLIKTYLMIILLTIVAPIQIMLGAISPAAGGGFTGWLRAMITNLAVYPTVGALFMVATLFLSASYPAFRDGISVIFGTGSGADIESPLEVAGDYWYPPMTFGGQDQATGWDPLPMLWIVAAIGVLSVIPSTSKLLQGLISGRGDTGALLAGGFAGMDPRATAGTVGRYSGITPAARRLATWRSTRAERGAEIEETARRAAAGPGGTPAAPTLREIRLRRRGRGI